jgi:hypothetical protein
MKKIYYLMDEECNVLYAFEAEQSAFDYRRELLAMGKFFLIGLGEVPFMPKIQDIK